ncbi:siderophore-interacting protein [Solwaraspora sp. WMMD406]|uniref:siderophore-interacting protein n=1 Tax=Solwaraspora sp. WMMD406 TaxID=3016095 RepID=UPI0024170B60|nr:siderophore-interacting protein [Solwaraspora sp. WMMD406]MDG4766759.1 siderophore-interacting protein [Solwaraspora sp. WMMD406]
MPFTLTRAGAGQVFRRTARLADRTWLTPGYLRLRLIGAQLRGFTSPGADDHIRLFLPAGAAESAGTADAAGRAAETTNGRAAETTNGRAAAPQDAPSRELTPLAWDGTAGWLDLELVVHSGGLASDWAVGAPLGSPVGVGGPRGSTVLDGTPDAWFLAGDETAVPAIRRFVAAMPATATGRILVEVPDADHELDIATPPGVRLDWVHRGHDAGRETPALVAALDAIDTGQRPDGGVFGFVAGEQSVVSAGRALLHDRWRLPADQTIVKGYWKRVEESRLV